MTQPIVTLSEVEAAFQEAVNASNALVQAAGAAGVALAGIATDTWDIVNSSLEIGDCVVSHLP